MTPAELFDLVRRHGAEAPWDATMVAGAITESGGNPAAVGDDGHSVGLWQINDQGLAADWSPDQLPGRADPEAAAQFMVPVYKVWWESGVAAGYTGEELVRYVYMYAERPYGFPDLYANAANHCVANWRSLDVAPEPEPEHYEPPTVVEVGSVEDQLRAEREWGTALLVEVKKWAVTAQEHIDALQAVVNTMKENAG